MPVRRNFAKRFKGTVVKSGYIYTFRYQAWENDPVPTVVMMYALEGMNANTGHQWRFFQALNFSYIPRASRRRFAADWQRILQQTQNPRFTWELVKRRYPYLKHAIRRYFFKPTYYISNLNEVPFDNMEQAVISTFSKDFSGKVKKAIGERYRKAVSGRKTVI